MSDSFDPEHQRWSRKGIHTAWVRRTAAEGLGLPTCEEFRRTAGLSDKELRCNRLLTNATRARFGVTHDYFDQGTRPWEYDHTCELGGCANYMGLIHGQCRASVPKAARAWFCK